MVDLGFHPIEVKKGIEMASFAVLSFLEKIKKKIKSEEDVFNLAMIVSNGEKKISEIVTKAISLTEKNTQLQIEESITGENNLSVLQGMILPFGMSSKDFAEKSSEELVFENSLVLVLSEPIRHIENLVPILEFIKTLEKPLIIFSPEIKKEPLSILLFNLKKGNLKIASVNVPDHLDDQSNLEYLKDICLMTGAQLCTNEEVLKASESFMLEGIFGACQKANLNQIESHLLGTKGDKEEINKQQEHLKYQIEHEKDSNLKMVLQSRLTNIQGKTVVIGVGGVSESEIAENRDKIVDCLNSCQSALEHGILPGGGSSFIHCLSEIDNMKTDNINIQAGVTIFKEALFRTVKKLLTTPTKNSDALIEKIISNSKSKGGFNPYSGYDLKTNQFFSSLDSGIIDSFLTIKTAIEDAVSVGSLIITTECIVFKEVDYERKV
jgi:chaperonin GroEL